MLDVSLDESLITKNTVLQLEEVSKVHLTSATMELEHPALAKDSSTIKLM